ncbi:putative peptidase family-domain-containing protein [Collybia nuda]|uniref:Peptidase family-domain-containing protein n=1 Tax=Collybia nuda TaxID=64659 RepID=A0A9P6CNQ9_9AGAR|nr:putative peptidase family-domain-containing protein [Collybia nuda]
MFRVLPLLLGITSCLVVLASPLQRRESLKHYTNDIAIHSSCNATQSRQLKKALADTYEIVGIAQEYVLANGPQDPLYKKYFGKGDYIAVLGALDGILVGNKEGVLLRCDDIDGKQEGWAGHWRGENATYETVICDLSYEIRRPLEQFCGFGYTVAGSSASYYFATDMMHRLYHVPVIADAKISHHADSYEDCLELAVHNFTWAPYNTHTLQYFAADVFGKVVGAPGIGCTGDVDRDHDHKPIASASRAKSAQTPRTTASITRTATVTITSKKSCHTHDDGEEHCD